MYRFNEQTGELYFWNDECDAYVFVGNYSGLSESEAIEKYEYRVENGY